MDYSPIILFAYNRPQHTKKTVEALQKNYLADESRLIIYADGAKNLQDQSAVDSVREYLHNINGFKSVEVIEREKNFGLADSIIGGVTSTINHYGRIIVLEDDIVTSPYFLTYMNAALDYYTDSHQVFSISGYNHPPAQMKFPPGYIYDVYFSYRNSCWGWATWQDRWAKADWYIRDYDDFVNDKIIQKCFEKGGEDLTDMLMNQMEGKIDSWAIRWTYAHFKNHGLALWPVLSYVNNIGHDGSGIHCNATTTPSNDLSLAKMNPIFNDRIETIPAIIKSFRKVYRRGPLTKLKKIIGIYYR